MKRSRPSIRRLLPIAAAAVAGLAATLVMPHPANAATADVPAIAIVATPTCQPDGTWKVHWTISNNNTDSDNAEITDLVMAPAGTTITGLAVGTKINKNGSATGDQIVPGAEKSAGMDLEVKWSDSSDETGTDYGMKVEFEGTCTPLYTVAQDCNGITFTFRGLPPGELAINIPVELHPSVGSDVKFTIKSGDSDKTVNFPGSPGLTVAVKIVQNDRTFTKTESFTHAPCPTMPVTGSDVTRPVAIGSGLLAGGIVLIAALFLLRRRRTAVGG